MSQPTVSQLYRQIDSSREYCFNIEASQPLSGQERENLRLLLADGFLGESVSETPCLTGERVVEVGPRMNFATASDAPPAPT